MIQMTGRGRLLTLLACVLAVFAAVGCGESYVISGKVIRGSGDFVAWVDADDTRLQDSGVGSAQIQVYRDPTKPNKALAGKTVADSNGDFKIFLDQFGVGWMDEEWLIKAGRQQYGTVESVERLPSMKDGRMLLIGLAGGVYDPASFRKGDELMEQYEKFR